MWHAHTIKHEGCHKHQAAFAFQHKAESMLQDIVLTSFPMVASAPSPSQVHLPNAPQADMFEDQWMGDPGLSGTSSMDVGDEWDPDPLLKPIADWTEAF